MTGPQDSPPRVVRPVPWWWVTRFRVVVYAVAITVTFAIDIACNLPFWPGMAVAFAALAGTYLAASGVRWGYRRAQHSRGRQR
jgi:hypothetical protein